MIPNELRKFQVDRVAVARRHVAAGMFVLLFSSVAYSQSILFVDANATGAVQDGSSWRRAFIHLQDALHAAAASDGAITEIRVADGVYTPDRGAVVTAGDRSASFYLLSGVALRGGYAGFGASAPDARDVAAHETILSGDLSGDDSLSLDPTNNCCSVHEGAGCEDAACSAAVCRDSPECCDPSLSAWTDLCVYRAEISCCAVCTRQRNCENSYHVVYLDSQGATAVLDGVTVADGNANGPGENSPFTNGGGLRLSAGRATIENCRVARNAGHGSGGGAICRAGCSATFRGCVFEDNRAKYGGGISVHSNAPVPFENCRFEENDADFGGAVYVSAAGISIQSGYFRSNTAIRGGGILFSYGPGMMVADSTFIQNASENDGGAICLQSTESIQIHRTSFQENRAQNGGALGGDAGQSEPSVISDSEFVDNAARLRGGAVSVGATMRIQDCRFERNGAGTWGGAAVLFGDTEVHRSTFKSNASDQMGGAIFTYENATLRIADSGFIANRSGEFGGALYVHPVSRTTMRGCTLFGNEALSRGGALYDPAGGTLTLQNSIVWGNRDADGRVESSQISWIVAPPSVDFSILENWSGLLGGKGNTGDDPMFADPAGWDGIIGTSDDDFRLSFGSPCIDAGDSEGVLPELTTDLAGDPRIVNDPASPDTGHGGPPVVDMGAYEYQPVYLDILPGECPNEINPRRGGIVRMAVVGTASLEAWRINTTSLAVTRTDGVGGAVKPIHRRSGPAVRFDDVSRPIDEELCACTAGSDGVTDVVLGFSARELVEELELDSSKADIPIRLLLSGSLIDGSAFTAADCVTVVPPRRGGGVRR